MGFRPAFKGGFQPAFRSGNGAAPGPPDPISLVNGDFVADRSGSPLTMPGWTFNHQDGTTSNEVIFRQNPAPKMGIPTEANVAEAPARFPSLNLLLFSYDASGQSTVQRAFQEVDADLDGISEVTFKVDFKGYDYGTPQAHIRIGMTLRDSSNATLLTKETEWRQALTNNSIETEDISVDSGEVSFPNVAKIEFFIRGYGTIWTGHYGPAITSAEVETN